MRHYNHQSEPLPEARSPAVILDRALANACRPQLVDGDMIKDSVRGTLREALQPATIAELIVLFVCLWAPAAILFFSGG
jgi:hypothetical protein